MKQTADERATDLSGYVRAFLEAHGASSITMTDATEAIWGSSGRGNPNAVRLIEACAVMGYLRITRHGKVRRRVELTAKSGPVPEGYVL